jgi:hypothetical protein
VGWVNVLEVARETTSGCGVVFNGAKNCFTALKLLTDKKFGNKNKWNS